MQAFEIWRQGVWYEHVEEYRVWNKTIPPYTQNEYFEQHDRFLRAKYEDYLNENSGVKSQE